MQPDRTTDPRIIARFWAKVDKQERAGELDPCWLWTSTMSKGYGRFFVSPERRDVLAHRFAYELVVGSIPGGLELDHLCRNKACVNPEHLEPVTHAENMARGLHGRLKKTCPHGHPWIPENLVKSGLTGSGTQHYRCKTCSRAEQRRYRRRSA